MGCQSEPSLGKAADAEGQYTCRHFFWGYPLDSLVSWGILLTVTLVRCRNTPLAEGNGVDYA